MTIAVDIADRLYDYTDEEKAAEAVALYQADMSLDDASILAIWRNEGDPRRMELERRIFGAVDDNGSKKRAEESIPFGISLLSDEAA